MKRKLFSAITIITFVLTMATAAATFGVYDWLNERFRKPIVEVEEAADTETMIPLPVTLLETNNLEHNLCTAEKELLPVFYSEDNDIRVKIHDVKIYPRMAQVHMSIQDVSGRDRISERSYIISFLAANAFILEQEVIYFNTKSGAVHISVLLMSPMGMSFANQVTMDSFIVGFDNTTHIFFSSPITNVKLTSENCKDNVIYITNNEITLSF